MVVPPAPHTLDDASPDAVDEEGVPMEGGRPHSIPCEGHTRKGDPTSIVSASVIEADGGGGGVLGGEEERGKKRMGFVGEESGIRGSIVVSKAGGKEGDGSENSDGSEGEGGGGAAVVSSSPSSSGEGEEGEREKGGG